MPVVALKKEETVQLMFSCYRYTPEIELNIEWQMAFLVKRINIDMMDGIATLAALHLVENFILCNKHFCLFSRHLGLMTKKVLVIELKSQLDSIWQQQFLVSFK